MKDPMEIIKNTKLFAEMKDEDISSVLSCLCTVEKKLLRGQHLYRAGEKIANAALVLEGAIHIYREDYWGNSSIIAEAGEGELLGEVYSYFSDEPAGINAVAVRDSVVILMDIRRMLLTCGTACSYHTKLIQNFVRVIADKNRELTQKIEHLSQRSIRGKLMSYLSEQSLKAGSDSFVIPFNRQQLADFLSVDRSAMSKELGKLKEERVLDFYKNHFTLMD